MLEYGSLLGLVILVFDFVALVDVIGSHSTTERKLLWSLAIVMLPILGMILYFTFGRHSRDSHITL